MMDQDGANVRYLTRGDDLVLTPRFSPSTQEITYMAFGQGDPRVYLFNIETGQREIVGNFPGMTFSPRFSPDGQRVIMSLQQGGNSNLFVMDLRSKATTRLTDTAGDRYRAVLFAGRRARICFESDRGGKPQIYVMPASGGPAQRISFGDGNYSTPVWSPRGDYIAFTKQGQGKFAIGVMKPDGSGERILTEGFHNEGPTFAPNGRVLMFFRDPGGSGGPSLYHDRHHRPQRTEGADARVCLRPGLVAVAGMNLRLTPPCYIFVGTGSLNRETGQSRMDGVQLTPSATAPRGNPGDDASDPARRWRKPSLGPDHAGRSDHRNAPCRWKE